MGNKILGVYQKLGSFGRAWFWEWRVNVFLPSEDAELFKLCVGQTVAFTWNTLCKDGRCPCDSRDEKDDCNNQDGYNDDPRNSYINIQFCPNFFTETDSLNEVICKGKNAPKHEKYDLSMYWENRGQSALEPEEGKKVPNCLKPRFFFTNCCMVLPLESVQTRAFPLTISTSRFANMTNPMSP
jgi:hypothetical protein